MTATRRQPATDEPVRPVTLRDVAKAAGTTPMTVSNVVNGRAGQVGAELRQRVLTVCENLGYRPHAGARLLRTNRHLTVGVIIVDPSPHYLSDPFTAALLAGLSDVFGQANYAIILEGSAPEQLAAAPVMRRIATDGLIVILSGQRGERQQLLDRVAALGQPMVLVQDDLEAGPNDLFCVLQDDQAGGVAIARHLFSDPCQHAVMLVPGLAWPAIERREAGVREVLGALAAPPRFHVVRCGDEGFDATQAAIAAHVARHGMPDVVIGGNDRMAIAAMKWLTTQGCAVPDDVRVTGFNGFDFWRYATPELTTIRSPAFALGEEAARAMITRLENGRFPGNRQVLAVEFAPHHSSVRHPAGSDGTEVETARRPQQGEIPG